MGKIYKLNSTLKYILENKIDLTLIKNNNKYVIIYDTIDKGPYDKSTILKVLKQLNPSTDIIKQPTPENILDYIDSTPTKQIDLTVQNDKLKTL